MDPVKEAFARAKQDIDDLKYQFSSVLFELSDIKRTLSQLIDQQTVKPAIQQTEALENQAIPQQEQEESPSFPTDNSFYRALKPHIYSISTGNEGVPTNSQTHQQTNQHPPISTGNTKIDQIEKVSELLASLDTIKKDLRIKFKHLTKQEMLVFSVLYQLEEEQFIVDYPLIAKKLALSESSIRDYIQRIIRKGIPIQKSKENNKKIILSLSPDFKKIASLQTILQLREL
jgi:hypothetical protein